MMGLTASVKSASSAEEEAKHSHLLMATEAAGQSWGYPLLSARTTVGDVQEEGQE